MAETLDTTLVARLRETVARGNLTEAELRELSSQTDDLARALRAQIRDSERRLRRLTADGTSGVSEIADELRRVESMRTSIVASAGDIGGQETEVSQAEYLFLIADAHKGRR